MKAIKLSLVAVCAVLMLAGSIRAADEKKPCCEATVEAGKKCEHKCCVKAAGLDKVCKKCHPAKEVKKEAK